MKHKIDLRKVMLGFWLLILVTGCSNNYDREFWEKAQNAPRHTTTEWDIEPSFKYDALWFINTLTGDPYFLNYYQDEYDKFQPKLTPEVKEALANLQKAREKTGIMLGGSFSYLFSLTDDATLDDMIKTVDDGTKISQGLKLVPGYSLKYKFGYDFFIRDNLKEVLVFLRDAGFEVYWKENILPKVQERIAEIKTNGISQYNIVPEIERYLGFALPSNKITIYMLYYAKPFWGEKINGTRFLTNMSNPFEIQVTTAIHEMMHPPLNRNGEAFEDIIKMLKKDKFITEGYDNLEPAWGYNTFELYIEENCVDTLQLIISEKFGVEPNEAHEYFRSHDNGLNYFGTVLYKLIKEENYPQNGETFEGFLMRIIREAKIVPGQIEKLYDEFYE